MSWSSTFMRTNESARKRQTGVRRTSSEEPIYPHRMSSGMGWSLESRSHHQVDGGTHRASSGVVVRPLEIIRRRDYYT